MHQIDITYQIDIMSSNPNHKSLRQKITEVYHSDPTMPTNILSKIEGTRFYITFNRPKRYNAFTPDMYHTFTHLIIAANQHPDVKYIIISGSNGNFSSGNDLSNFTNQNYAAIGTHQDMTRETSDVLQDLCAAIIKSKKPIFAIPEGKVIGFAFTQLALYDRVFAVDNAEFNAPLVQLAQGPEMCASYTFPKIFGPKLGEDLIVLGTKVKTQFLSKYGFLQGYKTRVEAEEALTKHLQKLDQLQWNSYLTSRQLFRQREAKILLQVNEKECTNLVERWNHPDLPAHIINYMARVKNQPKL